jgi:membrane protease subunit HflK
MANGQWSSDLKEDWERLQRQFGDFNPAFFISALLVLVLFWVLWSSWYTVQPEETAVVQRFGRVQRSTGPGLHFKMPLGIETVKLVPTARVLKEEFGFRTQTSGRQTQYKGGDYSAESLMLTGDLNVIDVQWIVQFRVENPVLYLFKVREQQETFRAIAEAVMRRVVGNRVGSDVLTVGRVAVASEVKEEMQKILSDYETGVRLITVELQDVTPPDPVKPAYNEVNEARQDLERMVNQAQEQANKVIPRAAGEAKQAVAEAQGYATERVNQARGEAARFSSVLAEYQRVPDVTRRRLYLEAMSEVLSDAKTVYIVDSEQRALIPLLSLDSGQSPPPIKVRPEEPKS